MPALLSVWRPSAFGAPELIVILMLLLVLFSGHVVPARGRSDFQSSRLSRGEILFFLGLVTLLVICSGILLARQFTP